MASRIWERYIKDSEHAKSEAVKTVWRSGIPSDYRLDVWRASLGEGNDELFEAGANALSFADAETIPEELIFQLESLHTSPSLKFLSTKQIDRVGMIVQCHAEMGSGEAEADYNPGAVQIVARIVSVLGQDPTRDHKLLGVYSKMGKIMQEYIISDAMRNDFALLLALLRHDLRDLCEHFDKLGLDIMDLLTIVELWLSTLFADGFPESLSFRAMDIVMIEGSKRLIFLVYGILKILSYKLIRITESRRLFDSLTEIPQSIRYEDVKVIVATSRKVMADLQSQIGNWRRRSWQDEISRKGKLDFIPSSSKDSHRVFKELTEGLEVNEDSGDEDMQERERSKLVSTLETLASKTADHIGKRALEQALDEIRAYGPSKFRTNTAWPTGTLKRNRESKGSNPDSRVSTLDSVQREAIAKGFVPYSQLYQYQDFPCLYMEGYLQKPRSNSTLHKRFFVLHGSYLTHFRSHKHRRSQRDVAACVKGATISPVNNSSLAKYGLEITLGNGTKLHTLFADDSQIQQVWIRVLQAAAKTDD